MIADLSGYTALTEAHGSMSAAKIVTRYLEIVHEALHQEARLVERVGDEVLIVADDAGSILRTAIRLRDTIELELLFPTIHVGIHAGSVLEQDGRYFGTVLNLASRVAAHAQGGQILCTEQIAAMVDLDDVDYRTLGVVHFKNIIDPAAIFEVVVGHHRGEVSLVDPVCQMQVKGSAKNNFPFSHPIFRPSLSDPSRPGRDKILEIVPLSAGWFCNFGSNKSDLNLGAKNDNLFFAEP